MIASVEPPEHSYQMLSTAYHKCFPSFCSSFSAVEVYVMGLAGWS